MITATIVLYNTSIEDLHRVITSYQPTEKRRLFLIDNSTKELSLEIQRKMGVDGNIITYQFNHKNIGYGAAHNIGIRKSIAMGAKYHIVMNPDVAFDSKVIDELKKYADAHSEIVYMLPKVVYPNGKIQYLCKLLPTPSDLIFRRFLPKVGSIKKKNDKYELRDFEYNKIINPPCLSGCFMFLRINTIKENNLFFDERFFMYMEDFDLMRRLHRIGKTIFFPYVTIVHDHARGSYRNLHMLFEHIRSACLYFNKYGWFNDPERNEMNRKIEMEIFQEKSDTLRY